MAALPSLPFALLRGTRRRPSIALFAEYGPMKWDGETPRYALVVDDEREVIDLIRLILESLGYEVDGAASAFEALEIFPRHHWEVVITDRVMPGMNGDELRDAIRRLAPETPLLLVSGHSIAAEDVPNWDAVLAKPFSLESLSDAVAKASLKPAAPLGGSGI